MHKPVSLCLHVDACTVKSRKCEWKVLLYYTLSVQLVNDQTRYQACLLDACGNISSYVSLKIWLIKCVLDI